MGRRRRVGYLLSVLCGVGSVLAGSAPAQEYRQALEKPPVEVYRSMLQASLQRDGDAIRRLLTFLGGIPRELQNKFRVDLVSEIETAIAAGHQPQLLMAVRKLIFYDMKDLFFDLSQQPGRSPVQREGLLKAAYLDYGLLAPAVKERNPNADGRIRKLFQQAASQFSAEQSPFSRDQDRGPDLQELRRLLQRIERVCVEIFPEFSGI